jgi:hypothetical protein
MKRLFLILFCAVLMFGLIDNSLAEPYRNPSFPPDQVIAKWYGPGFISVAGKHRDANGVIYLFIYVKPKSSNRVVGPFLLTKLDTNIWIIKYPDGDWTVLER